MTGRLRRAPPGWLPLAVAILLVGACAGAQPSPMPPPPVAHSPAPPSPALPPPATIAPERSPPAATPPPAREEEQPLPAPADPELAPVLQRVLDAWRDEQDVTGAVLGLRLADGRTAIVASGATDDEGGQPIDPGHRFRIGSITKTFVATLVLQLVDEDLVELDAPLAEYLPDAPFATQVTVRQLLAHRSGMPDFGARPEYAQLLFLEPGREWSAQEVIGLVADQPLQFDPGSRTSYSNTNYVLAGMLAEEVGGAPLAELLSQRISRPAGLYATYLEELEPAPAMAVSGHFDLDGDGAPDNVRGIPYTALVTSGAAAGGLSASALDVLDFAVALFEGDLLSDDALAEMTDMAGGYGLGIFSVRRGGQPVWGHDGALPGFATAFGYLPEAGISVVVMANQSGANVHAAVERALTELAPP